MIGCPTPKPTHLLPWTRLIIGFLLTSPLFTGCVAQQADLARIQKDLEQQILKLKEEKKALGDQVTEARAAIAESQNLIAAQKADMSKMRSDLAPLNQQIKLLREQDLTSLYGKYEVTEKRLNDLQKDLNSSKQALRTDLDTLQTTVQSQGEQLSTAQTQATALAQQVDETNVANAEQMTKFQGAFEEFKTALTALGTEVSEEKQRASSAENKFSSDIDTYVRELRADLTQHQQELGALQTHSTETSQSIAQLQKALEDSGALLGTGLEAQSSEVNTLKGQIAALQEKLQADNDALKAYLENDVQTALSQLGSTVDQKHQGILVRVQTLETDNQAQLQQLNQRLDQQQQDLQGQIQVVNQDIETLGKHVQADATHMQELSQSVVKLREAQAVMGSLLGKRGDEIIQQAGRISERMNSVESHQAELTQQLQSNTDKTSTHLAEVTTSLNALSQTLNQTSQDLTNQVAQQESAIKKLNKDIADFQRLKKETQGQMQQMQSATNLTNQLRQTMEEMSSRIHELEIHQSGVVGKLDSDAQTTTTHLQEVNKSLNSMAQALESATEKLNTRVNEQEKRLNRAITHFSTVQGTTEDSEKNLAHLNQLTQTVNQLRSVVNTIGTKLGERVDEHENRLGQLATRVNHLGGSGAKKR